MSINKTKELANYIFIGVLTTLINYVVYFFLINQIHYSWLLSNTISWIFAVIFAYIANRNYVFQSKNNIANEAWLFILLRLITLLVESIVLFLLIQVLYKNEMLSKVIVSLITVLVNYILCKQKIFQRKEGEYDYE